MRNVRLLIILAILVVLGGVVAAVLLPNLLPSSPPPAQEGEGETPPQREDSPRATALPSATPIQLVDIVIAVQELPRGFVITPNSVALAPWPADLAPFNAMTNLEDVVGKIARTDIAREQPVLSTVLVENFTDLARVGSDAAAVLPSDQVAMSLPIDRLTSVAYAIQRGDRVDVIISMLFVDVDEVFQTILPNELTLFTISDDGSINFLQGIQGRPETSTLGPVILGPSERQRPRLVTQRTVQDALIVYVGNFPLDGKFLGLTPTPRPRPEEEEEQEEQQARRGDEPPPPTATPARPDIVTLAVSPQDAVILTYVIESRLPITFALRSATATSQVPTDPVTLDYVMNEFNITLPQRRNFSIEPAIRSIRQLVAEDEISLSE